jgi:hypothetical protein
MEHPNGERELNIAEENTTFPHDSHAGLQILARIIARRFEEDGNNSGNYRENYEHLQNERPLLVSVP